MVTILGVGNGVKKTIYFSAFFKTAVQYCWVTHQLCDGVGYSSFVPRYFNLESIDNSAFSTSIPQQWRSCELCAIKTRQSRSLLTLPSSTLNTSWNRLEAWWRCVDWVSDWSNAIALKPRSARSSGPWLYGHDWCWLCWHKMIIWVT